MQPTDSNLAGRGPAGWTRRNERGYCSCRAFTVIEMLFVVAIIGILIALLLPAVQTARETARRHSCANNLYQLVIATHHYAAAHQVLPPGTIEPTGPIQNRPVGYHLGWVARILPFVEQGNVYDRIDFSVGAYHARNVFV